MIFSVLDVGGMELVEPESFAIVADCVHVAPRLDSHEDE
jgi:hypothetical protein